MGTRVMRILYVATAASLALAAAGMAGAGTTTRLPCRSRGQFAPTGTGRQARSEAIAGQPNRSRPGRRSEGPVRYGSTAPAINP
jgi:hypothetical protein